MRWLGASLFERVERRYGVLGANGSAEEGSGRRNWPALGGVAARRKTLATIHTPREKGARKRLKVTDLRATEYS